MNEEAPGCGIVKYSLTRFFPTKDSRTYLGANLVFIRNCDIVSGANPYRVVFLQEADWYEKKNG
jgi:hypothetical protein